MHEIGKLDLVSAMLGRGIARVEGHATAFTRRDKGRIGEVMFQARRLAARRSVSDVSFDIRRGEIAGLAGLLGAGRTETARLVFGADKPRAGEMHLEGFPYAPRRVSDAIAAGFGFCTEDRKIEGVVPDMTVAENMMLAMLPRLSRNGVLDETKMREIVEHFITSLDIKCSGPNQRIRELSGGNQQKVLLGKWLETDPRLLMLDEPTRGVDVGAKGEIYRLLFEARSRGIGILISSSEIPELLTLCDRIVVMFRGRVAASLSRAEASEAAIAQLAGGQQ
jgi:ribose transport system ATP-binding protein